ncbi:uncharacterized protein METZ01_LOCUS441609, partial [marine metagenome]
TAKEPEPKGTKPVKKESTVKKTKPQTKSKQKKIIKEIENE